MSDKYPRMPHVPWSPGCAKDDRMLAGVDHLLGRALVVTEKMDGSNVCLERGAVYARSHNDTPRHESFDALKALHATVRWRIPEGVQVFGEWLWAKHSIAYDRLPAYLLVFGVRDTGRGLWLSWEETAAMCADLGFCMVPVLWRGTVSSEVELEWRIDSLLGVCSCGAEQEGVVVRVADSFPDTAFGLSVAKWVRAGHVQTGEHWSSQKVVRNVVGTD